jgi:D-alanyl-D-alanine dipeptidase
VKLALAGLLSIACGREAPSEQPRAPIPDAASATILADARELIVAIAPDWDATKVTLRRFKRADGTWKQDGAEWPGVIGKSGSAWGSGLHGVGAPAGRSGPIKREGDGKSPAGAFALGGSYGYASAPPAGTRLPYQPLDDAWKCVDDPTSKNYNRVLDRRTVTPDWKSAEDMRRPDELYSWVVDVGHNTSRVPAGGSCIFLHVWKDADGATLGCTAMGERTLANLIATLDPKSVFVLLPRAEYASLAKTWGLPQ